MPHHTASRGLSSPSAMTEAVIKVITVVPIPGKAIITEFTFIHCVPGSGEGGRERENAHALYMTGS